MTCKSEVSYDHLCYMQNMSSHELDKNEATQYLFYDFECMQETGTHIPNLVVCQDEMGCEWSFSGPNTAKEFCDWLLVDERPPTICIVHNMQGYDGYFIMKHVLERGIKCELIMRGSKILYMEVLQIKFIDSLNFLSMPLSVFPKTFGLSELKKGYFPHSGQVGHGLGGLFRSLSKAVMPAAKGLITRAAKKGAPKLLKIGTRKIAKVDQAQALKTLVGGKRGTNILKSVGKTKLLNLAKSHTRKVVPKLLKTAKKSSTYSF